MTASSKFYETNPADPEAPVLLAEHAGPHGTIRPGATVTYCNPQAPWLGNPTSDGRPMTVTELLRFPALLGRQSDYVTAVLDGGEYESNADCLRPVPECARSDCSQPVLTPVTDPADPLKREFCSDSCLTTAAEQAGGAMTAIEHDAEFD